MQKNYIKSILAALLMIVLVVSLAACGSGAANKPENGTESVVATEGSVTMPDEPSETEDPTINTESSEEDPEEGSDASVKTDASNETSKSVTDKHKETSTSSTEKTADSTKQSSAKQSKGTTQSSTKTTTQSSAQKSTVSSTEKSTQSSAQSSTQKSTQSSTEQTKYDCSKSGHKWNSGTVTTAAACSKTGVKTYTCTVCGSKENRSIAALGHSYKNTVVAPTASAQGYTLHTCTRCGTSYKDTYTAKLGTPETWGAWNAGAWKVTKAATCSATGTQSRTLTRTSNKGNTETKTETQSIQKNPSNHAGGTEVRNKKDATCTAAGYTGDTYCKGCGTRTATGKSVAALGHSYGSWQTTTSATCTAKGTQTRACSRCSAKETKDIASLGHDWKTQNKTVERWKQKYGGYMGICLNNGQWIYTGYHCTAWTYDDGSSELIDGSTSGIGQCLSKKYGYKWTSSDGKYTIDLSQYGNAGLLDGVYSWSTHTDVIGSRVTWTETTGSETVCTRCGSHK